MKKILFIFFFLVPVLIFGQTATQLFDSTGFSKLRSSAHQGVYSHNLNKSWFCFMDESNNPYLIECDHNNNNTWGTPTQLLTQSAAQSYNYPSIGITPDDRVVMTYACPHDVALGFSMMTEAGNMASIINDTIDLGYVGNVEYPRIYVARNGDIFMFYVSRSTQPAHKRDIYYVVSTDGGYNFTTGIRCIDRDLADLEGLSESSYIGYIMREPFRVGIPERWHIAGTSSGGFQYWGVHDGGNGSSDFIDSSAPFGGLGSSRWFYDITNSRTSAIVSGTATTVDVFENFTFNNGDSCGIAYHDIVHADIKSFIFQPESTDFISVGGTDLGDTVTSSEITAYDISSYTSPRPLLGNKDVVYVPPVIADSAGQTITTRGDVFYKWNKTTDEWDTINATNPGGDQRFLFWYDSNYYSLYNSISVYHSSNLETWSLDETVALTGSHGYAIYANPVLDGNAYALVNAFESDDPDMGYAWAVSYGTDSIPRRLFAQCSDPTKNQCDTFNIDVYICDETYWSATRLTNATNSVTLTALTGTAEVISSSTNAVDGKATLQLRSTGNTTESIDIIANSTGLEPSYVRVYVTGDGETVCPVSSQPEQQQQRKHYFGGNNGIYFGGNGKMFMR